VLGFYRRVTFPDCGDIGLLESNYHIGQQILKSRASGQKRR